MSTTDKIAQLASLIFTPHKTDSKIESQQQAIVPVTRPLPRKPVSPPKTPIIINVPPVAASEETATLSQLLRIGRTFHPLCRNAFVEQVQIGYYGYERRLEYRTCALAAAYAGAFGPDAIKRPNFSYSMAVWRLSQRVGYNIGQRLVTGPTGRRNNVADEMIKLTDENYWTREGVAEWLESLGL